MKKNRFYKILALIIVMTLALFLTPTAFAADDDDLPPLIPSGSGSIDDLDDLPPLIPKVPPGKKPPTKPPIKIPVPDDGEDLDIKLSEDDIKKLKEGSGWSITINDTWIGTYVDTPFQETILLSFVADKAGGDDMFGTYKARAALIIHGDHISDPNIETQSKLYESENFTIELTARKPKSVDDDDDIAPLVLSKNNDDDNIAHLVSSKNSDDDDLEPLVPHVAEFIGDMPATITVLADPYNVMTGQDGKSFNQIIEIYVNGNGSARMYTPNFLRNLNDTPYFLGTLSRSIDGRKLS